MGGCVLKSILNTRLNSTCVGGGGVLFWRGRGMSGSVLETLCARTLSFEANFAKRGRTVVLGGWMGNLYDSGSLGAFYCRVPRTLRTTRLSSFGTRGARKTNALFVFAVRFVGEDVIVKFVCCRPR